MLLALGFSPFGFRVFKMAFRLEEVPLNPKPLKLNPGLANFLWSVSDEFPAVRLCQLGGWEKSTKP